MMRRQPSPLTVPERDGRAAPKGSDGSYKKSTPCGSAALRVPSKGKLSVLFNNRAAIGGFTVNGSPTAGWYWSSTEDAIGSVRDQRFSDGGQSWDNKFDSSSLRCVR